MGQKTQPIGFRLGINRTWDSRWFGGKSYGDLLHQDIELRKYLFEKLKAAAVSKIVIERPAGRARITIYAGRPGLVIGKKGQDIETLKNTLSKKINAEVSLNIIEIRKPELDAKLVADGIAQQLERRVAFRRAMKRAVQSAIRLGAEGVRIKDNTITTTTSGADLTISSQGSPFVKIDSTLRMPVQDDSAVVASSATMIAIFGKDPDKGKTGVWFKNKYNHEDELISTNRSLLYSMLF